MAASLPSWSTGRRWPPRNSANTGIRLPGNFLHSGKSPRTSSSRCSSPALGMSPNSPPDPAPRSPRISRSRMYEDRIRQWSRCLRMSRASRCCCRSSLCGPAVSRCIALIRRLHCPGMSRRTPRRSGPDHIPGRHILVRSHALNIAVTDRVHVRNRQTADRRNTTTGRQGVASPCCSGCRSGSRCSQRMGCPEDRTRQVPAWCPQGRPQRLNYQCRQTCCTPFRGLRTGFRWRR